MGALLSLCVAATGYCHHVLHVEVVFTHLFYVPITLAGIWWGRRGLAAAGFLGALLLVSHMLSPLPGSVLNDLLRASVFLLVGFIVGWLSDLHRRDEGRLIEMNITKDKFFSIIAHDLRSPFQNLLFLSQTLCDGTATMPQTQVCEYARGLCTTSKRLFSLVEDLLEWSRIETGTVERQPALVKVGKVVEEVAAIYGEAAARKGVRIDTEVQEDLAVWADRNHLRCILRNLVSNAVKFTRRGGAILIEATSAGGTPRLAVTDNGVGVPAEMMGKIFRIDAYHSTPGTENERGSGLGLVLCKELVELNGGTLSVQSTPGEGSSFSFTLPER